MFVFRHTTTSKCADLKYSWLCYSADKRPAHVFINNTSLRLPITESHPACRLHQCQIKFNYTAHRLCKFPPFRFTILLLSLFYTEPYSLPLPSFFLPSILVILLVKMAPSITMNRQSHYLKPLSHYSAAIYIRTVILRCIKHETICWRNSTRFSHIKPLLTPLANKFFLEKSYHKIDFV